MDQLVPILRGPLVTGVVFVLCGIAAVKIVKSYIHSTGGATGRAVGAVVSIAALFFGVLIAWNWIDPTSAPLDPISGFGNLAVATGQQFWMTVTHGFGARTH